MPNLADSIELYLLYLLDQSLENNIAVQRSSLAEKFRCAPSQINYVLERRFTLDRGFLVRSRRGGGGHIMIIKLATGPQAELLQAVIQAAADGISESRAEAFLQRLAEAGIITAREHGLLHSAVQRETLPLPLPERDQIRGNLLRAALSALLLHLSADQ